MCLIHRVVTITINVTNMQPVQFWTGFIFCRVAMDVHFMHNYVCSLIKLNYFVTAWHSLIPVPVPLVEPPPVKCPNCLLKSHVGSAQHFPAGFSI